jgi:hypothetical protein
MSFSSGSCVEAAVECGSHAEAGSTEARGPGSNLAPHELAGDLKL